MSIRPIGNRVLIKTPKAEETTVGGILPIAAKKLKLDPAIMASPLITTIVDACALVIYFTMATALLHI